MTLTWDVLVPAYNAEDTIGATVASALAQDPRPARVLVYSDGSTDDTARRARAAGAHVIDVAENRGVGHARQVLLEHATAPWVLVLDADDRLLPHAGRILAEAVAARPGLRVVGFGEVPDTLDALPRPVDLDPGRSVGLLDLWSRNRFISSSTLIRRTAALRIGGFPPVRRLVDYAFWLVLAGSPEGEGALWRHDVPVTARSVHGRTITGDVLAAVRAERALLLEHADAALADVPRALRGAVVRGRLGMLWWRGLSRHVDYGRPASSYVAAREVVPGRALPLLLQAAAVAPVRRSLRAVAAGRLGRRTGSIAPAGPGPTAGEPVAHGPAEGVR